MLEALEYYQELAQRFPSRILIGPGIVIVLAGLCIWLAGLRWRKIIGALAGASIGATSVFATGNYPTNAILAASVICVPVGVIINRIILGMFGAVFGAAIVMIILSNGPKPVEDNTPMVEFVEANADYNPDDVKAEDFVSKSSYPRWPVYETESTPIPVSAALDITAKSAGYYVGRGRAAVMSASLISLAGAAGIIVIAILAVIMVPRLYIATVSAALGSAIIFVGMILLLFYKNSMPINRIADRPQFYAAAFGAMVVFGTLVQLILSPSVKHVKETDEETKGVKK